MEHKTNTVSFACKLLGSRVRIRLDHFIDSFGGNAQPDHVCVSARMTACSGSSACGWRRTRLETCPFRCAAGI